MDTQNIWTVQTSLNLLSRTINKLLHFASSERKSSLLIPIVFILRIFLFLIKYDEYDVMVIQYRQYHDIFTALIHKLNSHHTGMIESFQTQNKNKNSHVVEQQQVDKDMTLP